MSGRQLRLEQPAALVAGIELVRAWYSMAAFRATDAEIVAAYRERVSPVAHCDSADDPARPFPPEVLQAIGLANLRAFMRRGSLVVNAAQYDLRSVKGLRGYIQAFLDHYEHDAGIKIVRRGLIPACLLDPDRAFKLPGNTVFDIMRVASRFRYSTLIEVPSFTRLSASRSLIIEAVKHEVAHLLCWPTGQDHNDVWKNAALFVGATPHATSEEVPPAAYLSHFRCPICDTERRFTRYVREPPTCSSCSTSMRRTAVRDMFGPASRARPAGEQATGSQRIPGR